MGIIKGHWNELFNKQERLHKERMAICNSCPLFTEASYGKICNQNLYINPKTDEFSTYFKEGYIKGCGCRLDAKTRDPGSLCPAKKW